MNTSVCLAADKVFKGMLLGVVFALIDFTCGNTVTKHFLYKNNRHFYRPDPLCFGVVVGPVLKMVAVSAFVMKPC